MGGRRPHHLFLVSHHRFSSGGQSKISRSRSSGVSCRSSRTSRRLPVMGWSASETSSVARGRAAEAIFCVKSAPRLSFLVIERGQLCWLLNCRRWRRPGRSARPTTLITRMTRGRCQSARLAKKAVAINLIGRNRSSPGGGGLSCLAQAALLPFTACSRCRAHDREPCPNNHRRISARPPRCYWWSPSSWLSS